MVVSSQVREVELAVLHKTEGMQVISGRWQERKSDDHANTMLCFTYAMMLGLPATLHQTPVWFAHDHQTTLRDSSQPLPETLYHSNLSTKAIQSSALSLQSIHDIQRRDGLALRVLRVGDSITDDTLEESFQDATGLFVDHCEQVVSGSVLPGVRSQSNILAEIRLTPPRRARRRIAGLVIPWMLSRRILR